MNAPVSRGSYLEHAAGIGLSLAVLLAGCALLKKGDPLQVRYFAPDVAPSSAPAHADLLRAEPERPRLRLGRVSGAGHLGTRIVYRGQAQELGYYEELRWSESPEAFVRRKLQKALFEEGPLVRVVSGPAPTLDVELVGLEEVRAESAARCRINFMLQDGREVLLERTVVVDRAVLEQTTADRETELVGALLSALDEAVQTIAARIISALGELRAASEEPPPATPLAPP